MNKPKRDPVCVSVQEAEKKGLNIILAKLKENGFKDTDPSVVEVKKLIAAR